MDIIDLDRDKFHLRERFLSVQGVTEGICSPLSPEDALVSVTAETSPPKWHLGHTSWFYAKFVLERFSRYELSPEFDFIFNSYYKGVGSHIDKSHRQWVTRPGLEEILQWRREIRDLVLDCLDLANPEVFLELEKILELGTHHEEQHQELLLMDIKRNFFQNPLRPRYRARILSSAMEHGPPIWVNVPSGFREIGSPLNASGFKYDNESDAHLYWIDSFMLMSHLVTNEDYLHFVQEGGYESSRFWLSDGWDFVQREGWKHPLYWEERDEDWWMFTLSGMVPLDLRAPVCHLSYYEADAFARFRGARLPTEFEWEAAARKSLITGDFLESGHFEAMVPREGTPFTGIHGTVWEWTRSAYLPYPRYESFTGRLGEYNSKFMVNQMVLRGGSAATPRAHYRSTYRNFYYPQNRWQFSGLRLAKDLA